MAKKDLQFSEMFKQGLEGLTEEAVKSSQQKLTEEEIKSICKELLPDLDKMIADKIKGHFSELADFVLKKFMDPSKEDMLKFKKNISSYIPKKDYKKDISDLRQTDDPFKISFEEGTWKVISLSGVERGKWKVVEIPYGFCLEGFDGENVIVVLMTSGQNGSTKITVVHTSVDLGMNVETAHVNWQDQFLAVQDMINKVYFS